MDTLFTMCVVRHWTNMSTKAMFCPRYKNAYFVPNLALFEGIVPIHWQLCKLFGINTPKNNIGNLSAMYLVRHYIKLAKKVDILHKKYPFLGIGPKKPIFTRQPQYRLERFFHVWVQI